MACNTNAQNGYTMAASHGKVFYIDTSVSPVLDAGYIGYRFTNATGSTKSNLWVSVGNFTGGKLGLANPDDQYFRLADVANNATVASYFMLKATSGTSTAQTHDVKLWDRRPDASGASVLYQCTYSFSKIQETLKTAANKVTDNTGDSVAISASTTAPKLGETVSITVEGATGNIGNGSAPDNSMVWLTPAAVSSWPTRALRLEAVSVVFDTSMQWNNAKFQITYTDQLFISGAKAALTNSAEYRATYTFRVIGRPSSTVKAVPVTQISSGTQVKHADTGAAGATLDLSFSSFAVNATVTKSVPTTTGLSTVSCSGGSCSAWGGVDNTSYIIVPYKLTASTTSASTKIDELVDVPAPGALFYADAVNAPTKVVKVTDVNNTNVTWSAPVLWSSESALSPRPLHFVGPFSMTSAKSATLDYWMAIPNVSGTYSNKAYALVGTTPVGASGSAMSKVNVTASGGSSVTAAVTTESFPIAAVTQPASSLTSSGAVLNGSVDPNGTATLTGQFEYSTNADLSSPTTVTATTPASGSLNGLTDPTPVAVTLSGLASYTTYYYRVKASTTYGDIMNFTTLGVTAAPTATTDASGPNSSTAATLNGTISPNMTSIVGIQFLYGTSNTLSTSTIKTVDDSSNPGTPLTMGGMSAQSVSYQLLAGTISAGTTYYYKVRACTAGTSLTSTSSLSCTAYVEGSIQSFTTGSSPTVATSSLPSTLKNAVYSATLSGTGGSGTYTTWTQTSGTLPAGLALDGTTGTISGTVTSSGPQSFTFGVKVTDSLNVQSVEKSLTITVNSAKVDQTITFSSIADRAYSTSTFNVNPTSTSFLAVSLVSTTNTVCDVAAADAGGYDVYMYTTGTCSLTASQAGNSAYNAATDVVRSFVISKNNQSVTYQPPNKTYGASSFTHDATTTASSEGFTPTYSGGTSGVCSITSAGAITILGAGTCTVKADYPGNSRWNSGSSGDVTFTVAKKNQTISFSQTGKTYGASPFGLNATSDASVDGGSISYTSTSTGVCTVSGSTLTIVTAGDCSVTASHPGNSNWNSGSAGVTFTVAKKDQTVTFAPGGKTYGDNAFPAGATTDATGDGSISYGTSTPGVCTVSGSTVTIVAAGDCTLTASHPGNGNWNSGSKTATFTVGKKNQTITFSPSGKVFQDPDFNLDAGTDATGGGSITFSSTTTSVCTVSSSGYVSIVGAGNCTVTASHPGNTNWNSGTSGPVTFAVAKKNQTITFTPSSRSIADGTYDLSTVASTDATGTGSMTFSGGDGITCSVASDGVVTLIAYGTCNVTASHPGNGNWNSNSTNASFTISNKFTQTISFSQTPKTYGDPEYDALATSDATPDGGTITYSSTTPGVCTVTSTGHVVIMAAGNCTLTADHPGNSKWNSGSKSATFTVGKKNQTVTFSQPDVTYKVADFDANAASNASVDGGSITYTSSTGSVCSVSLSGKVSALAAGDCTLTAEHPGNGNWNSGSKTVTFKVNKKDQTVSYNPSDATFGDTDFGPGATSDATSDGGSITYSSSTPEVCTIVSGKVHVVGAGTCTVTADHPGNGNWNSGSKTSSFAVNKKDQTVSFDETDKTYGADDFDLSASTLATSDGGSITYSTSTSDICDLTDPTGVTLTIKAAGTCTLTANHPGNGNWNSGSKTISFAVNKRSQSIAFSLPDKTYGDSDVTPAPLTDSELASVPFDFTSTTTGVCTIVAGKVHIVGAGTCTVKADHPGNSNWLSGSKSTSFNVGRRNQTVNFSVTTKTFGDANFDAGATSDATVDGGSITYTTQSSSVCDFVGGNIRIKAAGTCSVTAEHAGNTNWNSGSKSISFTVNKKNQTINFSVTAKTFGDANFAAGATSDVTGAGSMTYTSSTSSVCTVTSGGTVTLVDAGTCTLTASHPGNGNWNGNSKNVSFAVGKSNQSITFSQGNKSMDDSDFNLAPSTNADSGTFTFTSSTPSVCTVTSSGRVTLVGPGVCSVTASHTGNSRWNSGSSTTSFSVTGSSITPPSSSPTTVAPTTTTLPVTTTTVPDSAVGDVAGTLWFDVNKNGKMDKGEPRVPGATVALLPNGQVGAASALRTTAVAVTGLTTVTEKDGSYVFASVPVGSYKVNAEFPKSTGLVVQIPMSIAGAVVVAPAKQAVIDMPTVGVAKTAGVTVDAVTTQTISKAPVTCVWEGLDRKLGTDDDVIFTSKSDESGNYILDGIPTGDFSCKAKNPDTGYVSDAHPVAVTMASAALSTHEVKPVVLDMGKARLTQTGVDSWRMLMYAFGMLFLGLGSLGLSRRRRRA